MAKMLSRRYVKFAILLGAIGLGPLAYYALDRGSGLFSGQTQPVGLICEEKLKDFGSILPGSASKEHKFILRNTSNKIIRIANVRSSCGCAVAEMPENSVQPGQTMEVPVVTSFGESLGRRDVAVFVETDCLETPKLELRLTARIESPIEIRPGQINFGTVKPGTTYTETVTIVNHTGVQQEITGVKNSSDSLKVLVRGKALESVQSLIEELEVGISLAGSNSKKEQLDSIIFNTGLAEMPELKLKVIAQHEGAITARPSILVFRKTGPSYPPSLTTTIKPITGARLLSNSIELVDENNSVTAFSISSVRENGAGESEGITVAVSLNPQHLSDEKYRTTLQAKDSNGNILDIPVIAIK